ncbi:MAG: hypothetical protein Q9211_001442 [Gyalolechia sp. 1 TL-2023]
MTDPCASCDKIGHLACRGCVKAPTYLADTAPPTYYCSQECQKLHWPQHKDRCKVLQNRKMLHRAAKVIQDLYYIVLRKSFMHWVEKVDRIDEETMFIHVASPGTNGRSFRVPGAPPGSVSSDPIEELAALTSYGCTNSVATMGPSIQLMLKDVIPFVFESQLVPLNRKLWAVLVHTDGAFDYNSDNVDQHEVFLLLAYHPQLPMQEQERYALDLTHTQYGHQDETLMPWGMYVETRVRESKGQHPIGWAREYAKKYMTEQFGQDGLDIQIIAEHFQEATTAAIREFSGWLKLWKEPDDTVYQRKVDQFMQHVTMRLDGFIAAKTNDDFYKLWKTNTEKRLMENAGKKIRKEKHKLWGPDLRGPAFVAAMKLVKDRQVKERKEWGTPEEEKARVENRLLNSFNGMTINA